MKKILVTLIIISLINSCLYRKASLIEVVQNKDNLLNCVEIEAHLKALELGISKKAAEINKSTTKDWALAVATVYLFFPIFFMDHKDAEYKEIENMAERYNHLVGISKSKNCLIEREPIPIVKHGKSVEEELEEDLL